MDVNKIIEEYEKSKKLSFYEKFCNFCYQILKIKLSKEEIEKFEETNKFCNLRIYPAANVSASIFFLIFSLPIAIFISFFIPFSISFFLFIILSFISFLIYYYPFLLSKIIRNSAASEIMHSIIYMCISLKQVPNLERAIIFSASNLHGYVGNDFKRITARILLGEKSAKEGLLEICEKWYKEAREFSDALKLLISYSENPREELLEEAVRIVHEESFARMERYARGLKLPSTVLLGLGVILPLLTLVILPLFSTFFPQIFPFTLLIAIYNFFLPLILLGFVLTILSSRPMTTSYLLIENPFEIKIGKSKINIFIVLSLLSFFLFLPFFLDFLKKSKNYELCAIWFSSKFSELKKPSELSLSKNECIETLKNPSIFESIIPLIFLVFPFSFILLKIRGIILKREKIEKLEKEFGVILYQIGYYLKIGNTLEMSILKGTERYKKFEIKNFFEKILSNLRIYGSLEKAIFGEKGVIKDYPSSLIKSFFEVIVEIYRKGYIFAGEAMIKLSNFLTSLNKLQNKIEELISDVVNNLKFISSFLIPLITGTGVSLAIIILSLLNSVAIKSLEIPVSNETTSSIPMFSLPFFSINNAASIFSGYLVFCIGIYVIQIVSISSLLIVCLEKGFEKYYLIFSIIKNSLLSIFLYFITVLFSSFLIYPLISSILSFGP